MIAKCKAISHGRAMLEYAMREGKMERVVLRNMLTESTPTEILSEFEAVNGYNSRCRNKYLRFEIGIAPGDRKRLSSSDLNEIVNRFYKKMGLGNHQFIAVTHKDTDNLHIHLIANRIGVDGSVYDTAFVSNRSAKAAEEISRELGLTVAKEVKAQKQYVARGIRPNREAIRLELQKLAYETLRSSRNPKEFQADLRTKGVGVHPVKNKQGTIYGLRFSYKREIFKASEVGREFGLHSLFNHYGQRISNQKGTPFVPEYVRNPLPTTNMAPALSETQKSVGSIISAVGEIIGGAAKIAASAIETAAEVISSAASVSAATSAPSDNPNYDPYEAERLRRLRKKKKKGMRL